MSGLAGSYYADYQIGLFKFANTISAYGLTGNHRAISFSEWLKLRQSAGWKINGIGLELRNEFVVAIWIIEAGVVMACCIGVAWASVGEPYCERCEKWTKSVTVKLPGLGREHISSFLASNDLDGILNLQSLPIRDYARSLVLTVKLCDRCNEAAYLSVAEMSGGEKPTSKSLLTNACLTAIQTDRLLRTLQQSH